MSEAYTVKDIGDRVRKERKAQGMTQSQLADLCGVGLSFVSNLENGKPTLEAGKMLRVVNTLGLDLVLRKRGE
ncbi:MAG: helix-turn-helix transcriptional regulator [Eggerthellaceae bacterium]|jgi:HTH-type transcriptional regulator/antitoxin HipB|nr:helix-turn-helix transcriptional regulator [Eggerthellaceae bacterium]